MKIRQGERGSALMLTVIVVLVLVGISAAMLSETLFRGNTQQASITSEETQLICDAALDRARRALLEWRNADEAAWGEVLDYCMTQELNLPGATAQPLIASGAITTDPDTGEPVEASTLTLPWQLTNLERIKAEYVAANPGATYSQTTAVNTTIPAAGNYNEIFCAIIPFGRGAYHIVVADNDDLHGDGVDNDLDGDPWNADTAGELASNNSDPLIDGDRQLFLVITAILPNGTMRQNLVMVSYPPRYFVPSAAILSDGTIRMNGAFDVQGTQGVVMANENIEGNGGGQATVSVSVNAAGTASGFTMANPPPGGINSGVTPATIPTIDIPYYKTTEFEHANSVIILGADGNRRDVAGNVLAGAGPFSSSVAQDGTRTWTISGQNTVPPAIYYVEGDFRMTGQGNGDVYQMTIIAEGNVRLAGNSAFKPFEVNGLSTNTLALAGKDVQLAGTGNAGTEFQYEGVLIANEQISAQGNYQLNGSIVGVNATDSPGSLITNTSEIEPDVTLGGTPSITYNGLTTFVPPPARSVAIEQVRRTK